MNIDWTPGALDALASAVEVEHLLAKAADKVAEQSRRNVTGHYPGTDRASAISTVSGVDSRSAYADVGYTSNHPGFVMWWSEVGTEQMSPRPHLRAALHQTRL